MEKRKQTMKPSSGLTRLQRVSGEKLRDARALRRKMTPAEKALWELVRGRKCNGFKIRRQQIVEGFFTDFYCEKAKLAIEIDGGVHDNPEQQEIDRHREKVFQARGIKTIRFGNEHVLGNLSGVLETIVAECNQRAEL
jgi:very-short-patch-repair endonuclease